MSSDGFMNSINPATGENLGSFRIHSEQQVEEALVRSQRVFRTWSTEKFSMRANLMRRAGEYLRQHKARLAALMTVEMGKPVVESEGEVEKCAWNCDYYADNAELFLRNEPRISSAAESYIQYTPLGVVLAIMPWNYPFWQVFRFAAPALMAGNAAILKHASNVPQCALAIEEIFLNAGFPQGAFQSLLVPGSDSLLKLCEYLFQPDFYLITLELEYRIRNNILQLHIFCFDIGLFVPPYFTELVRFGKNIC